MGQVTKRFAVIQAHHKKERTLALYILALWEIVALSSCIYGINDVDFSKEFMWHTTNLKVCYWLSSPYIWKYFCHTTHLSNKMKNIIALAKHEEYKFGKLCFNWI